MFHLRIQGAAQGQPPIAPEKPSFIIACGPVQHRNTAYTATCSETHTCSGLCAKVFSTQRMRTTSPGSPKIRTVSLTASNPAAVDATRTRSHCLPRVWTRDSECELPSTGSDHMTSLARRCGKSGFELPKVAVFQRHKERQESCPVRVRMRLISSWMRPGKTADEHSGPFFLRLSMHLCPMCCPDAVHKD